MVCNQPHDVFVFRDNSKSISFAWILDIPHPEQRPLWEFTSGLSVNSVRVGKASNGWLLFGELEMTRHSILSG
jgi:hypothetical protein